MTFGRIQNFIIEIPFNDKETMNFVGLKKRKSQLTNRNHLLCYVCRKLLFLNDPRCQFLIVSTLLILLYYYRLVHNIVYLALYLVYISKVN